MPTIKLGYRSLLMDGDTNIVEGSEASFDEAKCTALNVPLGAGFWWDNPFDVSNTTALLSFYNSTRRNKFDDRSRRRW